MFLVESRRWVYQDSMYTSLNMKIFTIKYGGKIIFKSTVILLKYKCSNLRWDKKATETMFIFGRKKKNGIQFFYSISSRSWYSLLQNYGKSDSHLLCETTRQIGLISPVPTGFRRNWPLKALFACLAQLNHLCILNIFKIVLFRIFHFHLFS